MNGLGYTRDYAQQCAAWTINAQGPARKQCGLPVVKNIGQWVYFCKRHYLLVEQEIERELDTLNSQRVANLEQRLQTVRQIEAMQADEQRALAELSERVDSRRIEQTVYFIRCEQFVKIGISKDPAIRLRQIRGGGGSHFPRLLDVATSELMATEAGGLNRERELHQRFRHLRHTGEWFTEAPELTEYISTLQAAA